MKASSPRENFADELRGFALLGIVLVNVPFLALSSAGFTDASLATPVDRAAAFLVVAFAQAKFYLLFAFLFGYSLSFFLASSSADPRRRFRRRLFALGVIGVAHVAVGFVGDILVLYSVLGLVLLALWNRSDRALLATSVTALIAWYLLLGALVLVDAPGEGSQVGAAFVPHWDVVLATGSFAEAVRARLSMWPAAFAFIGVLNGLPVLAMFALGGIAGRRRLFAHPEQHRALWRRGLLVAAVVGVPCGLVSAWLSVGPGGSGGHADVRQMIGVVVGFLGAPALTAGYVSLLAELRIRRTDLLRHFRPAGRMSLSGYIGESLILSTIFCGYGFGWFGRVGAAAAALIGIATWLFLDLFSHWWQRKHDSGPLENLVRWWSRRQPSSSWVAFRRSRAGHGSGRSFG